MNLGLIQYHFLPNAAALTKNRTLSLRDVDFLFQCAIDQFTDFKRQGLISIAVGRT